MVRATGGGGGGPASKPSFTGGGSGNFAASLMGPAPSYLTAGSPTGLPAGAPLGGGDQSYNQGVSADLSSAPSNIIRALAAQQTAAPAATPSFTGNNAANNERNMLASLGFQAGSLLNGVSGGGASGSTGSTGALGSNFAGIGLPNFSAVPFPNKTLAQYIAEATQAIGPGTNYGALKSQVSSDTARANTNIGNMYTALQSGIRANDPVLQSIYNDTVAGEKGVGAQTQASINGAYNAASKQTAQQLAAVGAPTTLSSGFANADQANAVGVAANTAGNAETNALQKEAVARESNSQSATAAGFQGKQTQADLQQNLADNLAKIAVQQSQEDAQRRLTALGLADTLKNTDISKYSAGIGAQNTLFQDALALAGGKTNEQNLAAQASQASVNSNNDIVKSMAALGLDYNPQTQTVSPDPTYMAKYGNTLVQQKAQSMADFLKGAGGNATIALQLYNQAYGGK